MPGSSFGLGSHQIMYEAKDAAGYTSKCIFNIQITAPKLKPAKKLKSNKFHK